MNDTYVCNKLISNVCVEWVKYNPPFSIPNLTAEQVFQIFIATAMLFGTAWVFKELGFFIKRR